MTEATAKQQNAPSLTQAERKLAKAVERANQAFTEKNLRFTKLRQDVFEEIAATLEIPLNTAASRYRYGLDKLRTRLRPLYDEIK